MIKIDKSKENFELFKNNIKEYINQDINESDTRSKLIDSLLINVLGWDESDIVREQKLDSGYYDYKITIPGFNFIIEAKRNFKEFIIPKKHSKLKIKSILKENNEIFDQLRNYALESGVPYGVFTNGRQYIVTKLFNTDATDWKENTCLIFDGIENIDENFITFFDNLSKYSIINNGGIIYDLPSLSNPGKSIFSKLPKRGDELIRNELSSRINPIINMIFGEMFSYERDTDPEFIKKCFVDNRETKKNRSEIEKLFSDQPPSISGVLPVTNIINIQKQIGNELKSDDIDTRKSIPKPIVIIGSKGSGKSTFINHLFEYQSGNKDFKNHLILYNDLRVYFEHDDTFEKKDIYENLLANLYNKYESYDFHSIKTLVRIYFKEIKRKDAGVWKHYKENDENTYQSKLSEFLEAKQLNYASHFENISRYLIRERNKRLIVIIDNADQYKDKIQEQVFKFAHSLSAKSMCGSVISLREGYYYKWRFSPPFDAYKSNIYHITAPKYSEVLQKRIDYALQSINLEKEKISAKNSKGVKITLDNSAIIAFFSSLKHSIFSNNNSEIIDFINLTTFPNIREGLNIFNLFLTSGHTKVADYIIRESHRDDSKTDILTIPFHEFVKSLGLINKHYYNSNISTIQNILIPPDESNDHFIKFYILSDLINIYEAEGNSGKSVKISDLITKFTSFGYRLNSVNNSLNSLLKYSLIDSDEVISDTKNNILSDDMNISITSKGHYYIKNLVTHFHYFDLVVQDTPIFNDDLFQSVYSVFPKSNNHGLRSISKRVKTVENFINYLELKEKEQPIRLVKHFGKLTEHIRPNLQKDIESIKRTKN